MQVVSVDGGDDVEQAGDNDEAGAVIGGGDLHLIRTEAEHSAGDKEKAVTEVAGKAEGIEDVMRAGVELALHGDAEGKHANDGDGNQRSPPPFAQEEVTGAGDQPSCNERPVSKSATLSSLLLCS